MPDGAHGQDESSGESPGLPGYTDPSDPNATTAGLPGLFGIPGQVGQLVETAQRAIAGGAGFEMDLDEMKALLPQWETLRDELETLMNEAGQALLAPPPAADEASTMLIGAARDHSVLYVDSLNQQFEYAAGYVKSLEEAISSVEGQDAVAGEGIATLGQAL